ncbi:MAG: L-seryl-tRNA(Sec) selenium transferase [Kiritimatiellae bacterium]|nr:L-seryl-tRNA(Sec) selenium transferase [Kiritimatiellia bacterium]
MDKKAKELARALPAVDALLQRADVGALVQAHGRAATVAAIRGALNELRQALVTGGAHDESVCRPESIVARVEQRLARADVPLIRRCINAAGIILHTGLGRAVMPQAARDALAGVTGACNVQMDLATGGRIRREFCVRDLVRDLTGAEEVLVVNNNVGATFLLLRVMARGREVIVSRGELIEIGGSFRLPDVMRESGVVLREVGTTNKTHLRDYEAAIGPETALILKVHKSNYRIVGFTQEVGIRELVELGRARGVPVVDDLGCGALVDLEAFGVEHECTVRESLEAGSDIVLFSTDKLIGGPQGGMLVGRKELLDRLRADPFYRALRVDKMMLGALEATLRLFRRPDRLAATHPTYMMLSKTYEAMVAQAETLAKRLSARRPSWQITVVEDVSYLGGGSLPGMALRTAAVRITASGVASHEIARQLRLAPTPVIPRLRDDAVLLDMRTVFPDELDEIVAAVPEADG